MWYIAQSIVSSLPAGAGDPDKEQHEQARIKAAANLRRLDRRANDSDSDSEDDGPGRNRDGTKKSRPRKEHLELDQYESQIALEVVAPEDIPVGFDGTLFGRMCQ